MSFQKRSGLNYDIETFKNWHHPNYHRNFVTVLLAELEATGSSSFKGWLWLYQSFSLWSACYPEEIHFKRNYFGGCQFETVLTARPCLCDVIPSNSKLAGKGKLATDLASVTRSAKSIFPSDYHLTILNVFSLEFGAHLPIIIWLKSSYNPECLSDRMMSQEHGLAAEYG